MPPRKTARRPRRYDDLAILDYIAIYKAAHRGRSPSQRHIAQGAELSARSVAHTIVHRLIADGLLTMDLPEPGWPADLTITPAGWAALRRWRARQRSAEELPDQQADRAGTSG